MRGSLLCLLLATASLAAWSAAPGGRAGVPVGTFSGCPQDARPLPNAPLRTYEPAVRKAVLQFVRTTFVHVSQTPDKLGGARTTRVLLVRNWLPSGWIKTECGLRVWRRSVAVGVYFPELDPPHNPVGHCNDCASLVFLAARTLGGWTVWGRY